jgi:hypothetical protein
MKLYKRIIIAVFVIGMLFTTTHATEQLSWSRLTAEPEIDKKAMEDINLVSLRFCNDGTNPENLKAQLHLTWRPGQVKNICVMFFNNHDTGMNFHVWFTESKKDENNLLLCDNNDTNNAFISQIRENTTDINVFVKPHMQRQTTFNIGIPRSNTWNIYWCLTYKLDSSYSHATWAVFGMLIRKTAPIYITVTWDVYNFWRRDDIKLGLTTNKNGVLKVIAGILVIWIIVSIVQTTKKKEKKEKKHHKK